MTAINGQTLAYQFTATESFDGSTVPENATESNEEDQFYEASGADLGIFPVNDPSSEKSSTSRGNRWVTWLELRLDAPAPAGALIEIIDNTSKEGTTVALKTVKDVSGLDLYYVDTGFLVPQGAALRVSGAGAGVLRYHVTFLDPQGLALIASLAASTQAAGGGGNGPSGSGLVFSDEVATEAEVYQLEVGVIQRYNASALSDSDQTLRLPAAPTKDQECGAKEVGDSFVEVTIDGNGNDVETITDAPANPQSSGIARQSLTWKFDGAGTWRLV